MNVLPFFPQAPFFFPLPRKSFPPPNFNPFPFWEESKFFFFKNIGKKNFGKKSRASPLGFFLQTRKKKKKDLKEKVFGQKLQFFEV